MDEQKKREAFSQQIEEQELELQIEKEKQKKQRQLEEGASHLNWMMMNLPTGCAGAIVG